MPEEGITVIIPTFNEEKLIGDCIKSVLWADKIIVADTASDDATREIVRDIIKKDGNENSIIVRLPRMNGCRAILTVLENIDCKHDWIFLVEADDVISEGLSSEIRSHLDNKNLAGMSITRENIALDKKVTENVVLKVFRRSCVDIEPMQHHFYDKIKVKKGVVIQLQNHYQHKRKVSISALVEKINNYTDREVKDAINKGKPFRKIDLLWKPTAMLLYRFFKQKAYRGGIAGLFYAVHFAYYQFIFYMKLWEYEKHEK